MTVLKAVSIVLFALVGYVAATMAWKGLTAKGLLPFHQAATGRGADTLTPSEQSVAVALTRSLGLGFAVVTLSLLAAVAGEAAGQFWTMVAGAVVALAFCSGLAVINRLLARSSGVGTPWKQSLFAVAVIAIGLALGMV
ncbi:MAG TPA: hypothetical protein VGK53_20055 [Propionicimonas sp.]|jgi:hypothetical protein